jgi:hypothetical protein
MHGHPHPQLDLQIWSDGAADIGPGNTFTSAIWAALCQQLGIHHQPTTAFRPQVSGMVERCHRRLKDALRARLAGPDWPLHHPWVLMELRAAPTEKTGVSAADIVFGVPLVLPGQILDADEPPLADFIRSTAAFTTPLLRTDGGQALGCVDVGGVRVCPQRRHGLPIVAALQRPVKGPLLGSEGVPVAGGRVRGGGLHRPPEAAPGAAPVQPKQPPARGRPPAG